LVRVADPILRSRDPASLAPMSARPTLGGRCDILQPDIRD
jgi:hypothetical protein